MANKKAYDELEITIVNMSEQSVLKVSGFDNDGGWDNSWGGVL